MKTLYLINCLHQIDNLIKNRSLTSSPLMIYRGVWFLTKSHYRSHVSDLYSSYVMNIDLFILKNMGVAIIDFRVCPPLVTCKSLMFSGFIDTLMYGFSSTGVTIYCYFGLKFNDNTCCEVICKRRYNDNDKLPGMYFF